MNLSDLGKRAAKKLNLTDSSGSVLSGKDITEGEIWQFISDAYLDEVFPRFAKASKYYYEKEAYGNNWHLTGTVSASSTGTTLVTSTDLFNANSVGLIVHNTTEDETAEITAYTNATTVTLNTTIGDDWDGDTIRIVDRDFALDGDASDSYVLTHVGVKYDSNAQYFTKATPSNYNNLFTTGYEEFSQFNPRYIPVQVEEDDGDILHGFRLYPSFTTSLDSNIFIRYVEKPPALTTGTDVPVLPEAHHPFLYWAGVRDAAFQRRDGELVAYASAKFDKGLDELISNHRNLSADRPVTLRPPRRINSIVRRYR